MAIYRGLQKLNPSSEDYQVKQRDDFGPNSKKILAHVEQTDWLLLCYTVCVCDAATCSMQLSAHKEQAIDWLKDAVMCVLLLRLHAC